MGYLDNSVVTVEAILTKKGRELLAKGNNAFNITQFALADDEIDYDLWNQNHPFGEAKMGIVIENLPITEPVPDETQSMKYKLLTLDAGSQSIPYIDTQGITAIEFKQNELGTTATKPLPLKTKQWKIDGIDDGKTNQSYTITLLDGTYFFLEKINNANQMSMSGKSITYPNHVATSKDGDFAVGVKTGVFANPSNATTLIGKSTKIIITNNTYGSRYVIPVTIVSGT
jgi:hypothetical protein